MASIEQITELLNQKLEILENNMNLKIDSLSAQLKKELNDQLKSDINNKIDEILNIVNDNNTEMKTAFHKVTEVIDKINGIHHMKSENSPDIIYYTTTDYEGVQGNTLEQEDIVVVQIIRIISVEFDQIPFKILLLSHKLSVFQDNSESKVIIARLAKRSVKQDGLRVGDIIRLTAYTGIEVRTERMEKVLSIASIKDKEDLAMIQERTEDFSRFDNLDRETLPPLTKKNPSI